MTTGSVRSRHQTFRPNQEVQCNYFISKNDYLFFKQMLYTQVIYLSVSISNRLLIRCIQQTSVFFPLTSKIYIDNRMDSRNTIQSWCLCYIARWFTSDCSLHFILLFQKCLDIFLNMSQFLYNLSQCSIIYYSVFTTSPNSWFLS